MSDVFDYDTIPSGYYDEVHARGRGIQSFWHREKFRQVASRMGHKSFKRTLDVACGAGTFLGCYVKSGTALGTDIAEAQIAYAQQKYTRDGVAFKRTSGSEALREEQPFDLAVMIEFLEHVSSDESSQILREVLSCLNEEGEVIITTPNYRSPWFLLEWAIERFARGPKYNMQHVQHWTKKTLHQHLENHGYQVVEVSGIIGLAPFFAPISWRFAEWFARLETSITRYWGFLILLRAKRVGDARESKG